MGDKSKPADAGGDTDARSVKHNGADVPAKPAEAHEDRPFPNPGKNMTEPKPHTPKPAIKRRYPEPTD